MNQLNEAPFKVAYTDPAATNALVTRLREIIRKLPSHRKVVVVCIGSDRCTGDSLGPLSGSALTKYRSTTFEILGTLENPVHAMNLDATLEQLYRTYEHPFVIAVDACLGHAASVGSIQIGDGPLQPGAGVNKKLAPVGDIHISGVVNLGGFLEYQVLQNTRLYLVMGMANLIARSLFLAVSFTSRQS